MANRKENKSGTGRRKTTGRADTARRGPLPWLEGGLVLLGFALYANTLGHGYVLDDFSVIKENFLTMRGVEGIPELWRHDARYGYWNSPGELYRPLTMTFFAVEWDLAGGAPWLGHLMNVLLYALTGALMFRTLHRWMRGYHWVVPFLTALFFLAHPVHTEVVANIKSRDEILMLLFSLTALLWLARYLDGGGKMWWGLSLAAYTAAMFSKENGITFLAVIPLMIHFFRPEGGRRAWTAAAGYLVPVGVYLIVRRLVIGELLHPGEISVLDNFLVAAGDDFAVRTASALLLLGKYLLVLLFPHPLGSDFGYDQIPLTDWSDIRVWASFLAWAGLLGWALAGWRRRRLLSFGLLFFAVNFSLYTNLVVTIGTSYGERLLYAASPGFALLLALALVGAFRVPVVVPGAEVPARKGLWAAAALLLVLYGFKTIDRNRDWKDSFSLYAADVEVAPDAAKLNYHFGLELVQRGLEETDAARRQSFFEQGEARFAQAIRIYPSYHDAYSQLGLVHYRRKEYAKAMEQYELALRYKPNFALVYSNMGIIYFERGELDKAREVYEKAVQYDPRMKDALRNLGAVHAMQGNFGEAIRWFSQGLQYWPDDPTLNRYLGSAYRDAGQPEKGRPYLEKAGRLEQTSR